MELVRLREDEGVWTVWQLKQSEYEQAWVAREKVVATAREQGRSASAEQLKAVVCNATPVWQRVTGLDPENEWRLRPFERRGALLRLARTVERMVRAEWKRALEPQDARPDPFRDDENGRPKTACRYATRTSEWDPVAEICFYLQIAQTKLSDLLRQATGLRAREISDCVRVEVLRGRLKEQMRAAARGWVQGELKRDGVGLAKLNPGSGAAQVVAAYRASDGFLDRKKLALELGVGSRARLYRAVRLCEGMELEELERAVALEVFLELMPEFWASCDFSEEQIAPLEVERKRFADALAAGKVLRE